MQNFAVGKALFSTAATTATATITTFQHPKQTLIFK